VDLPREPERNTAGMGVLCMVRDLKLDFGIELSIDKGIPLGSGLGGSAASAVAAVVAANALLREPLGKLELLKFAMKGEAVASGSVHVDNIAPSLYGGLVLTVGIDNPNVKQIPVPSTVRCVLVHPHMMLSTREARQILNRSIDLSDVIWQSANLAGFLTGCFTGDLQLIRESLEDVIIEPQRQVLIPGFKAVKEGAMTNGALGCSISGAGPTVFAWCEQQHAERIRDAMVAGFAAHGLASDAWISTLDPAGARILE
jgi:homoserine kinase